MRQTFIASFILLHFIMLSQHCPTLNKRKHVNDPAHKGAPVKKYYKGIIPTNRWGGYHYSPSRRLQTLIPTRPLVLSFFAI